MSYKDIATGYINKTKAVLGDRTNTPEATRRLNICKGCPEYTGLTCKKCGCVMAVKVYVPEAKCPINKW
jgi:hypothetical protein